MKFSKSKELSDMKDKKSIFICFTGIDGSGKSTQAKNLVKNLSRNGVKSKYVYARLVPIIFRPLLVVGNLLFLRSKNINNDYENRLHTKKNTLKRHIFLSKLFYKIMSFDYLIQLLYKIKLPLLLNRNIVCDRYIYDTIITDIAVDMGYSEDKIFDLIERSLSILPTPDIVFLIDLPEEVAYKRKTDIPSIEYLRDRRKYYLSVADKFNMIKINVDGGIKDIARKIFNETLLKLEEMK